MRICAKSDREAEFKADMETTAARIEQESMIEFAKSYAVGPARVQLQDKDPRGWREFAAPFGRALDARRFAL